MKKFYLIVIGIFAIILIAGCIIISKHNQPQKQEPQKASFEVDGLSFDFSLEAFAKKNEENGELLIQSTDFPSNPDKVELSLDIIYQNPEYPAGCESMALTMMLNYFGYDIPKNEIIDNYLIYSKNNFVMGYTGYPDKSPGGGIYAPGMTNTANRFLLEKNSVYEAKNISGTKLTDIFPYVAKGYPVMVWTTVNQNPCKRSNETIRYGDIDYIWTYNEHCVLLTGYNLIDKTVTLNDSISGVISLNIDEFQKTYDDMWQMAMVLTPRQ